MSRLALLEYLRGLKKLYKNASKSEKTRLLNEAEVISGKTRRTLIRYLSQNEQSGQNLIFLDRSNLRGRKKVYSFDELIPHLKALWCLMERISSIRMHAALEEWLPFYDDPKCTPRIRSLLLKMSRSTLERLLKQIRATQKGIGTTKSALSGLKTQIPLKLF